MAIPPKWNSFHAKSLAKSVKASSNPTFIRCNIQETMSTVFVVLPLTGQSGSEGRHQLQLASYQNLERLEQILSLLPEDGQTNIGKYEFHCQIQVRYH